jgi:hypothetical protein
MYRSVHVMHDDPDAARNRIPSYPSMGGTFDRLVESNLGVIRVHRIGLFVRIALTAICLIVALRVAKAFSDEQQEIKSLLTAILKECKR